MVKVVVIGLGMGGMIAASYLAERVELSAIEPNPYHQLLYKIHLVAAGLEDSSSVILPLNSILDDRVRIINDLACRVDLSNRLVYTSKGTIGYDYLVIAAGSSVEYYGIENARRYAYRLNSVRDALTIHHKLKSLPRGSSITIVGGGATGISLAGAVAEAYSNHYRIRVVEALDNILEGWDRYIVERAYTLLSDYGVEILNSRRVTDVYSDSISLNDGTMLNSDLTVWTAGIRAVDINIMQDVKRSKQGRLVVDRYSRLDSYDDAFAIGDICAYTIDGRIVQQSAQFAVRQGYQVAKNIVSMIDGYRMRPIVYREGGRILSLGRRCIGVINGIPIDGVLCNYIEEFITYNYIDAIKGNSIALLVYEEDLFSNAITFMRFLAYIGGRVLLYGMQPKKDGVMDDLIASLCPLR